MKKKLLCVLWFIVLIVVVFICLYLNSGKNRNENLVQFNQGTDENPERKYLSVEECYNEIWEINKNPDIEDNWNAINCYNEQWEQEGKWISYNDTRFWKFRIEENYNNWKRNGKYIQYYEDWKIRILENYKDWEKNWESIWYDENWEKSSEKTYIYWIEDWESIEYWNGERWLKIIYKDDHIIETQENSEVAEKMDKYFEDREVRLASLWNKFISWDVLDVVDFKELTDSIYSNYNIYYDEEWKYLFEDMYREEYEDKSRNLLALYSMMTCSENPSNPDTYLFNLDNPKLAQETYFKNCPKWCRYSDEEGIDFICE